MSLMPLSVVICTIFLSIFVICPILVLFCSSVRDPNGNKPV